LHNSNVIGQRQVPISMRNEFRNNSFLKIIISCVYRDVKKIAIDGNSQAVINLDLGVGIVLCLSTTYFSPFDGRLHGQRF